MNKLLTQVKTIINKTKDIKLINCAYCNKKDSKYQKCIDCNKVICNKCCEDGRTLCKNCDDNYSIFFKQIQNIKENQKTNNKFQGVYILYDETDDFSSDEDDF